jgi:hypothetical protein
MKNYFIVLTALIILSLSANGQGIKVPEPVKNAFAAKFPGAKNIRWGKETKTEFEAEFKLNGTDIAANFKSDGNWVVTETSLTTTTIPVQISNAVKSKYPDAILNGVEKVEKPGNKVYYEAIIKINGKKKEVEINPDGSFIK